VTAAAKRRQIPRASYSVREYAQAHGVGVSTVWRWLAQGKLASTKLPSGVRRIPASEFNRVAGQQS
jgi:excisionase family DNA binding protein